MLQYLRIRNLALLEEATLEFDTGFTAVTGETGAGKSVLLGALSLLAGNRADKAMIRQGADTLEVEAVLSFDEPAPVARILEEQGLPPLEEGSTLILRRIIPRAKAARITINGALATLGALEALGETWIDFHGPGEPQKLAREARQREMLDRFAQIEARVQGYAAGFASWRALLAQADELARGERLSADELDYCRAQLEKFKRLDLSDEAVEALERDHKRLASSQEMVELAAQLAVALAGDEGITNQLAMLNRAAQQLAGLDPETAAPLHQRLESLSIETADLGAEYDQLAREADFDEDTVRDLSERMDAWLELRRKYGPTAADVRAAHEDLARRIDSQQDIEGTLERLREDASRQEAALRDEAAAITRARRKGITPLAKRVRTLLTSLGFKRAGFDIKLVPERQLTPRGDSACQFLFAPNAGQEPLPLSKIASSGEQARVMLALKTVLAEVDATPLLVFDEVDANVGGEIGAEVGRELANLDGRHQVLCVTHLPQVAARAAQHLLVEKRQEANTTAVSIKPVHGDRETRLGELARMLGDRRSQSARDHARELLGA